MSRNDTDLPCVLITRCSSMVEHLLMVQWFTGLIPRGGPVELFLIPVSAVLSVGMVHIKDPLLLI